MSEMTTMEAGRELDALVAEKVMGWRSVRRATAWGIVGTDPAADALPMTTAESRRGRKVPRKRKVPNYSTDIAAAWEVMGTLKVYIRLERFWDHTVRDTVWEAVISMDGRDARAHADTAPLAICRAALAAVEVPHV